MAAVQRRLYSKKWWHGGQTTYRFASLVCFSCVAAFCDDVRTILSFARSSIGRSYAGFSSQAAPLPSQSLRRHRGSSTGLMKSTLVDVPSKIPSSWDPVEVEFVIPGLHLQILEASVDWQERLIEQAVEAPEDSLDADPYGMAIWPSAQVLAQAAAAYVPLLSSKPGARVLELGAGCGLASLTLAALGVSVMATDFRKLPLQMFAESARRAGVESRISTQVLDVKDLDTPLPAADLVIAADLLYEHSTAEAVAQRVAEARERGSAVLIGDVGRPGRASFLAELKRLRPSESADFSCQGVAVQGTQSLEERAPAGAMSKVEKDVWVQILEMPPGPASAAIRPEVPSMAVRPEGHGHVL